MANTNSIATSNHLLLENFDEFVAKLLDVCTRLLVATIAECQTTKSLVYSPYYTLIQQAFTAFDPLLMELHSHFPHQWTMHSLL